MKRRLDSVKYVFIERRLLPQTKLSDRLPFHVWPNFWNMNLEVVLKNATVNSKLGSTICWQLLTFLGIRNYV